MNRNPSIFRLCNQIILAFSAILVSVGAVAQKVEDSRLRTADLKQKAHQIYGGMPLLFEKNMGQASSQVSYLSRMPEYTLFLTEREAVISRNGGGKRASALRMQWLNSNASPTIRGEDKVAGKTNYLIGDDSSQWHTNVANYTQVKYDDVYPGIDLVYYGNQQHIEYDLTVAPGADPRAIRLRFQGASRLRLDSATGDLIARSGSNGQIRFRKPVIYQNDGDQLLPVSGAYVLSARNTVSFALGDYDHTRPLVIDPYVVYSTMYGGSTAGTFDVANYNGMAVDGQGFVYLQGITSTANLPTTSGSFQPTCNLASPTQCSNFFVAKFDTTKSGAASLVYATYIGGNELKVSIYNPNGSYYQMNDIAADAAGDAYFTGASSVGNYPTTSNAYSKSCVAVSGQTCNGTGILTELDPTGSKLLYSTYIPPVSNATSTFPGGIAIDSSQVAYISGGAGQGLPTTDGSTCSGCYQAPFVAAFDTTKSGAASLVYAVYIPLNTLTTMAADAAGNVYLGGMNYQTTSSWPGVVQTIPLNGFQTTTANIAGIGPYLIRLNHAGVATYSTYIGSATNFGITAIATDPNGIAYAGGMITGPVTQLNGLPSTSSYNGYDAFIAKMDTTKTGVASLLYATYLTGSVIYVATINGLAANGTGQVAITGENSSTATFPEVNPLTQPVAPSTLAGTVSFIGVLDTKQTGANALTFLSMMDGVQSADFVAYDPAGNLVVGGTALNGAISDPFISVPASYATSIGNVNNPPFFYKISLASPSSLNISPSTLTFSSEVVNTTSQSQAVTVKNSGTTAITFSSIVASSQFAETDNCSPSLAVAASCTVNVTFTPTAAGSATGTLTFTDSDPSSPQSVSLNGTAIAGTPQAVVTPTTVPFGSETVNTSSSGQTVVLSNPGTAALTNITVSITGTNPTDFSDNSACGSTLAAGASCNISVIFKPSTTGAAGAALSITDNATGSPQTATLTGTGTAAAAPQAVLSPSALSFPSTSVGVTSSAQAVTLSNPGSASLTINGISLTGANIEDFAETSTCGSTLAAGSNCTISVTFTPASAASFSAGVSVADNAGGSPQAVTLSGTGVAATPADFTTSSTTPPQTVAAGGSAQYVISVQPSNGSFTGVVTLSATGLPPGATASFQPASLTPGSSGGTSNMTIQTAAQLTTNAMPQHWPFLPPGIAATLVGPLFFWRRFKDGKLYTARHLLLGAFVFALLSACTGFMTGCNAGFALPSTSAPTTYTITVTGTSGTDSHSTTVSLILQ